MFMSLQSVLAKLHFSISDYNFFSDKNKIIEDAMCDLRM